MKNYKILIVDDEENILKAVRREVSFGLGIPSKRVLVCQSVAKAMEILKEEAPDIPLILSDYNLPNQKGSDFLIEVGRLYPHIIKIMLTAYSMIEDINKIVKAGIFSFILKPWNNLQLISEIKKALDLFELKQAKQKYDNIIAEELKWGGELQKIILKRDLPVSDKIKFAVSYNPLPGLYCGGDYYDIIDLDEYTYLVLIGDVAGHGIKGALISTILKSIIYADYVRHQKKENFSPADFLEWLNNRMCLELVNIPEMLITFSAVLINLKAMTITMAKAGHLPLYLIRNEKIFDCDIEGQALGFKKEITYTNKQGKIKAKDKIVMFTDGLIEINTKSNMPENISIENILLPMEGITNYNETVINKAKNQFPEKKFMDDLTLLSMDILR